MLQVMETFEYIRRLRSCVNDRDFAEIILEIYECGAGSSRPRACSPRAHAEEPQAEPDASTNTPEPTELAQEPEGAADLGGEPLDSGDGEPESQGGRAKQISYRDQVEAFGEKKSLMEWVHDERCSVSIDTIRHRLHAGWDPSRAVGNPLRMPPTITPDIVRAVYMDRVVHGMKGSEVAKRHHQSDGTVSRIAKGGVYSDITNALKKELESDEQ
jgi:hypothetical protein